MKRPYAKCSYYCMKLTAIDKHFNSKGPLFFFFCLSYTVPAIFLAAMQLSAINAMFLPLLLRYKSFDINTA